MNLLDFYIPEWVFVALNLVILVFVLNKILWKPVNNILNQRQEKIENALKDAAEVEAEKKSMEARRLELEAELDKHVAAQMKDARVRAGREYDRIISEAESKARSIVSSALVQAEREREALLRDARIEVVSIALAATGALLDENMDNAQNQQFLEKLMARKDVS